MIFVTRISNIFIAANLWTHLSPSLLRNPIEKTMVWSENNFWFYALFHMQGKCQVAFSAVNGLLLSSRWNAVQEQDTTSLYIKII